MLDKKQFLHSVKWVLVSKWGREGILSLVTFILAAILGPTDFGTVAIATIYIAFIQTFVGLGFNATLIQRKDLDSLHLDSLFWLILASSLFFMAVSITLSEWWSALNHSPQLKSVIWVLSIMVPIDGLVVVQQALFHRKMDFKSLALRDNVSAFAGGLLGVGMALLGFGVWALVGQQLCRGILALLLLWKLSNWRPSFRFSASHAKGTLDFSFKVFVGKMADYIQGYSDALLLGIFLGPQAVGLYRLAARMMRIPLELVTRAIHIVSLPQFSKLQDDPLELKKTLLLCLRASSIVTIPILMGLSATSDLVMAVIGPEWIPAANVLSILCIVGCVMALTLFTGTLLQGISRPGIQTAMTWCLAIANVAAFTFVGIKARGAPIGQQIIWFASSRAMVSLAFLPVNLSIATRHTKITIRDLATTVGPAIMVGSVILLGVIILKSTPILETISPLFALALAATFSFSIGFAAAFLVDKELRRQVLRLRPKKLRGLAKNS